MIACLVIRVTLERRSTHELFTNHDIASRSLPGCARQHGCTMIPSKIAPVADLTKGLEALLRKGLGNHALLAMRLTGCWLSVLQQLVTIMQK